MRNESAPAKETSLVGWVKKKKAALFQAEQKAAESSTPPLPALNWDPEARPIVGVVTPVRNRKAWSLSFLEQMLGQSYPLLHIYIVDAASTDGTPEAIAALGSSAVSLISVGDDNYWTGATNAGVERALADGCDFILTINDDAIVPSEFVDELVRTALKYGTKIMGSMISYSNNPGMIWGAGAYNDWQHGNLLQTKFANLWVDTVEDLKNEIIEAECLCGNGTLVHRSVFESVGLYQIKYTPHYHADSEFTLRAGKHGIQSYVANTAWIYNRFFENTDGAMADRNRKLFSLRSASYLKPIIFMILEYCPKELRVTAFVKYFEKIAPYCSLREISRLTRIALQLLSFNSERPEKPARVLSSGCDELDFCRDIVEILQLEGDDFLSLTSFLLLRRQLSPVELAHYRNYVQSPEVRKQVILDIMRRPEFLAKRQTTSDILALLGVKETDKIFACEDSFLNTTICKFFRDHGRLPSTSEIRDLKRVEALSSISARRTIDADLTLLEGTRTDTGCSAKDAVTPIVYMNIDVLCMAQLDERARTGVYRYVSSLITRLRQQECIILRTFYSPNLELGYEKLCIASPWIKEITSRSLIRPSTTSIKDIAFYPYFPFQDNDARFNELRQVFTLCDLFPITHPMWFTDEASLRFKRQFRSLISAEHIFCISHETQKILKRFTPSLRASSSVAYLGVDPISADTGGAETDIIKEASLGRRFFLCIGTLEPRKNLKTVLEAFAKLLEKQTDTYLYVVGSSGWNIDFSKGAGLLGDRVHFLGSVTDAQLSKLYSRAICTVFPSLAEGFGFPIVESFAHGTPVITSNSSSMAEVAGDAACLVDALSSEEISKAMSDLSENNDLRARYSSLGQQRAKNFTWDSCAEGHVKEFLKIVR